MGGKLYLIPAHIVQQFKRHQFLRLKAQRCWFRCDVLLEADNDKTKPSDRSPEKTISGSETTNGDCEKIEREKKKEDDDDPKQVDPQKVSEASANKLEMFQEKQKFIEEQNRKRKEMLSKVNPQLPDFFLQIIKNVRQAILDRQKQTDQESRKLQIVQVNK